VRLLAATQGVIITIAHWNRRIAGWF